MRRTVALVTSLSTRAAELRIKLQSGLEDAASLVSLRDLRDLIEHRENTEKCVRHGRVVTYLFFQRALFIHVKHG